MPSNTQQVTPPFNTAGFVYIKRQQHFTPSRPRRPTCTFFFFFFPMENSGEELSSTVASHSFSGDGGNAASEESGWTSYIDYFMETQRHKEEVSRAGDPSTDDAGRCGSTSKCSSDTGVGASTWLPALEEPSTVVSRRLSLREGWRRKKVMYDESLQDTATSPISSPKVRAQLQAYYLSPSLSLSLCVFILHM